MLTSLYIKNFAIIKEVEISFQKGLHVITGETGAGKSIMLDALGLALGERLKAKSKESSDGKTVVEAQFDLSKLKLRSVFKSEEVDYEDLTILRREINAQGRSRAFVNDTPVNIGFLQLLAGHLIEVHQQFDQLALRESSFQYDVLDVLAKQKPAVQSFQKDYQECLAAQRNLEEKRRQAEQLKSEEDFLQFQLDELLEFSVQPESDDGLGDQQTMLSKAEEIQTHLQFAEQQLIGENESILDRIQQIRNDLAPFSQIIKIKDLVERLSGVHTELDDLLGSISEVQGEVEYDPKKLAEVEERLSILFRLKKKHQVNSAKELLEIQEKIDAKLQEIGSSDQDLVAFENQIKKLQSSLSKQADVLSKGRKSIIPTFEKNVQRHLKGLGMPDAIIQVALTAKDLHENGIDQVEFLFSSNKGLAPSPIKLTASGGEISRLNLAIKSEVAGEMALPTIIFDEIDSGVSGEVARKIAALLQKLSKKHQIVCITHTPQIASADAVHLHVSKDNSGAKTFTKVTELNPEERLHKIGEILDGSPPSKEALQNARKLLG